MLEIINLNFLDVLKNINLRFMNGNVYLISGDNGSGKTVLFKNILGLLKKSSGEILIDGKDISLYDNQIGALIEDPDFMSFNSGIDNLKYLASIRGNYNDGLVIDFLKRFDLYKDRNKDVRKYSLGMKKKLGIIQAIMENQNIVIFDEPTNGLDQESINVFYNVVRELKAQGKLIIIASHIESDIKEIVDIIVTIDNGEITSTIEVNKC